MASTGDWVTPKLYGRPWFEKPVLYYWGAAVGFEILKSPEYAARIPSMLGALTAAFAIAMLGWIFYGRRTAWCALLMFPTIATVAFARAATPDMLFSAFLTIALGTAAGILWREGALGELASDAPPTFPAARSIGFGLERRWALRHWRKVPLRIVLAAEVFYCGRWRPKRLGARELFFIRWW